MSLSERVGDKFKAGVELRTKRAMTRASLDWTEDQVEMEESD
jgi:hypothetical protein